MAEVKLQQIPGSEDGFDVFKKMGSYLMMEILRFMEQNPVAMKIVIFTIFIAIFVYRVCIRPFRVHRKHGIPHPHYKPFIGNISDIVKHGSIASFQMSCMRKLGTVFGFYVGRKPVITIADPTMLEAVLIKDFSNFHNRSAGDFFGQFKQPMELSLVAAKYEAWRRIRPTVSPSFSSGKLKQTVPLLIQSVDVLTGLLSKSARNDEIINVNDVYGRMTLEIILSVAFGLETDFQAKGDEKIFKETQDWFRERSFAAIVEILPLPKFIKGRLKNLDLPDAALFLSLLKPVVEERQKRPSKRLDFLQLLLAENKSTGELKLSNDDIFAQAITFMLAGYETTSHALAYTTYLLALHPEIQERLYKEIEDSETGLEDSTIYDCVQKFDYLDAVINESLRLYPPVSDTVRDARKDIKIGKYTIPAGTAVNIPIFAIHRFEDYWKDPTKFDPERFSSERKADISPYHFLPFGRGPRNCIGMRFALSEIKITLVKLLSKFRFVRSEETEEHPLNLKFGLSVRPANNIKVKIVERS